MPEFYEEGEATVEEIIQSGMRGRVYFRGSWWFAQCEQDITIEPGEIVNVVGISNITLLVEPRARRVVDAQERFITPTPGGQQKFVNHPLD